MNSQYALRHSSQFIIPAVNLVYYGTESVSYLGPKISSILEDRLKKIDSLGAFKMALKSWNPEKCPCRLRRIYIHNVGFI